MAASKALKGIAGLALVAIVILGLSYCSEAPKQRFAQSVIDGARALPGSRLIKSIRSGDLASPMSLIRPATTRLVYARPDISLNEPRFYIMSFGYKEPTSMWLASIDCANRKEYDYFPAQPGDTGEPARTMLGDPVLSPSGSSFLRHDSKLKPDPEILHALCETDWSSERAAVRLSRATG